MGRRAWWAAVAFLTRLPTPPLGRMAPEELAAALPWFPWVGAMLGAILALGAWSGPQAAELTAALLLILWVALSGNLHLDGLADTLDALAGGRDQEHRLALLKDPRSGPAAVSGVALLLLLKFAALVTLLEAGAWQALLLVPIMGRTALAGCFLVLPYRREQGLGRVFADYSHRRRVVHSSLAALVVVGLVGGAAGLLALLGAALVFWGAVWLWRSRFGGFTGDLAGATLESVEAAALVVWAAMS